MPPELSRGVSILEHTLDKGDSNSRFHFPLGLEIGYTLLADRLGHLLCADALKVATWPPESAAILSQDLGSPKARSFARRGCVRGRGIVEGSILVEHRKIGNTPFQYVGAFVCHDV